MKHRLWIAALSFVSGAAFAQDSQLSGIWKADGMAARDLNGSGAIIAPSGKLPYKPEALAQARKNFAARATADPETKCYQPGVPRAMLLPYPLQIVQNDHAVFLIHERTHAYRILYLDNAKHNDGLGFAMGDSRAHWEGKTLVADVLSFSDATWLDAAGHHHSEALHLIERYQLDGPDRLVYEARVEDSTVFTEPFTLRINLRRQTGVELVEDECEVDAKGKRSHVSPYRR